MQSATADPASDHHRQHSPVITQTDASALLRPAPPAAQRPALSLPGLLLDPATEKTIVGGQRIALSSTEFMVLYALAASAGKVVGGVELQQACWDDGPVSGNALDVTVHRLRKRLAQVPGGEDLIHTVRGKGYLLKVADAQVTAAA
jgi:DNA-binding response OmpR family regulator